MIFVVAIVAGVHCQLNLYLKPNCSSYVKDFCDPNSVPGARYLHRIG